MANEKQVLEDALYKMKGEGGRGIRKVVLGVLFSQLKSECVNFLQRGEEYDSSVT